MNKFLVVASFLVAFGCGGNDSEPLIVNGEACELDKDCESDLCLQHLSQTLVFPDGICTNECDIAAPKEEAGCGEGEICLYYQPTGDQHCYQTCEGTDSCRDMWLCANVGSIFEATWACIPAPL